MFNFTRLVLSINLLSKYQIDEITYFVLNISSFRFRFFYYYQKLIFCNLRSTTNNVEIQNFNKNILIINNTKKYMQLCTN